MSNAWIQINTVFTGMLARSSMTGLFSILIVMGTNASFYILLLYIAIFRTVTATSTKDLM
jgi:hypothetical protein